MSSKRGECWVYTFSTPLRPRWIRSRGRVVIGGLGVTQGVDSYEAEFVRGGDGGVADDVLELLQIVGVVVVAC